MSAETMIQAGEKYGLLTVTKRAPKRQGDTRPYAFCKCACGNTTRVMVNRLRTGNTKSCGCARVRNRAELKKREMIDKFGVYISSDDDWYQRAAGIWGRVQNYNLKTDFLGIPDLAFYLKSIAPARCPVFNEELRTGNKQPHIYSPSVDRVVPEEGYSRGNMQVVSNLANTMKQGANPTQLNRFAIWSLSGESVDMNDDEANTLAQRLKKEIQRFKREKGLIK